MKPNSPATAPVAAGRPAAKAGDHRLPTGSEFVVRKAQRVLVNPAIGNLASRTGQAQKALPAR